MCVQTYVSRLIRSVKWAAAAGASVSFVSAAPSSAFADYQTPTPTPEFDKGGGLWDKKGGKERKAEVTNEMESNGMNAEKKIYSAATDHVYHLTK